MAENPFECGYRIEKSVPYPSVDPGDIKGKPADEEYPCSANLEGFREELDSEEHEKSESASYEKEEHE